MYKVKSGLPPAKRGDYIVVVEAAYGAERCPVCSLCWSHLDYYWGRGRSIFNPGYLHPQLTSQKVDTWTDKEGEEWLVWEDINRCRNPECDGAAAYRYLPSKLSLGNPYHPEDLKKHKIKDKRFKKGEYDEDGIFRIDGKTLALPLDMKGVTLKIEGKWAYINPGIFKKEIPAVWTVKEGKIKTNINSNRFKQIRDWFAARRIQLTLPEAKT